jgi:hypothetical protein
MEHPRAGHCPRVQRNSITTTDYRTPSGSFVHEPAVTDGMPARTGGVDELGGEPLHPAVNAHMIDLHTSLGQQLLDVAVRQAISVVPADGQHDGLRREAEPAKADGGNLGRGRRRRRLTPECPSPAGYRQRNSTPSTIQRPPFPPACPSVGAIQPDQAEERVFGPFTVNLRPPTEGSDFICGRRWSEAVDLVSHAEQWQDPVATPLRPWIAGTVAGPGPVAQLGRIDTGPEPTMIVRDVVDVGGLSHRLARR